MSTESSNHHVILSSVFPSAVRDREVRVQWTEWPEVEPRLYPTLRDTASALGWTEAYTNAVVNDCREWHTSTPIDYDSIGKQSIQDSQHIDSGTLYASDGSDHEMDQPDNSTQGSQSPDPNPDQQQGSKTEEWQPVRDATYGTAASLPGKELYVRLLDGDLYSSFKVGTLPPGTEQKEGGKFFKFVHKRSTEPFVGTTSSLHERRGSIHYLLNDEVKVKVVMSHCEETCREFGARPSGKATPRRPTENIWTKWVRA